MDGIIDVNDIADDPNARLEVDKHGVQTFTVGDGYNSLQDVKEAVQAAALANDWVIHVKKRDRMRIIIGCRSLKECPYHVRAEAYDDNSARISSVTPFHTCHGSAGSSVKRQPASSIRFLLQEVPKLLDVHKQTAVADIQDAVLKATGQKVAPQQCRRVRSMLAQNDQVVRVRQDNAALAAARTAAMANAEVAAAERKIAELTAERARMYERIELMFSLEIRAVEEQRAAALARATQAGREPT